MPSCEVVIQIQNGGSTEALKGAWVYWREGGNLTLLRSNPDGRLFSLQGGADRNQPWQYTQRFTTTIGATVDIYYSRGALPIPDARLSEHNPVFFRRTIQVAAPNQLPNANVGPNNPPNTLVGAVTATVTLPRILITLTAPLEIRLWPILWELPKDCDLDAACRAQHPAARTPDYHTAGLNQGTAVGWTNPHHGIPAPVLPVSENSVAPAIPDHVTFNGKQVQIRPRERAAHFEGTIDSGATGVTIQMLDRAGNVVQLRPDINTASAAVDHVAGTVEAGTGAKKFKADIFFADAVNTFGIVQLFVQSVGLTPPIVEAFTGYLCGFQITLLDDGAAATTGAQRGPLEMDEAHEKLVVDFVNSPQTTRPDMRAETRLRRMCIYELRSRERPLDPSAAASPNVLRPEMPMWMAEFQAVGVSSAPLTTLMALRNFYDKAPFDLTLDLNWNLELTWDGPDHTRDPNSAYQYDIQLPQHQVVRMHFGARGVFVDSAGANVTLNAGELPNAFDPAPTALTFPVTGRRLPKVLISGLQRPWGRAGSAVSKDTLVVEYQLNLVQNRGGTDVELIRGGDGSLRFDISLDTVNVLAPSDPAPAIRLPRFRINGRNPTQDITVNDLETRIINALVQEYYDHHSGDAAVLMLPVDVWKTTARLIFHHESGGYRQFDNRNSQILFLGPPYSLYYGNEFKMPFFGGPHGYGIVQVDYGANPIQGTFTEDQLLDELWNFIDNLRGGVRHLMGEKATSAYRVLGLPRPAYAAANARKLQAVFQRATVRAYNGGTEFHWDGADYVIQPSISKWANGAHHNQGANPRLLYPNNVFQPDGSGANVTYFTGDGAANATISVDTVPGLTDPDATLRQLFPWPVAFAAGDFGPGI